jgi:hypothetical protein
LGILRTAVRERKPDLASTRLRGVSHKNHADRTEC